MNRGETPQSSSEPEIPPKRIPSTELFPENAKRIVIRHNDRDYVLIITKQGKLVLNRLQ